MKYELGLAKGYVSDWNSQDALREFTQNGIDQEVTVEDNAFTIDYDKETQTLKMCNKHSKLNRNTLLLGCSSKSNDDKTIGKFGEGYKLAVLVLLREGKNVSIENYGAKELWKFRFSKLKKYDKVESLTVDIDTKHFWDFIPNNDLTINISGITEEEVEEYRKRTLRLSDESLKIIDTPFGRIIKDREYGGKVFVNGLYVATLIGYAYGYDLKPEYINIGRDRNLVDSYELSEITRLMWTYTRDIGEIRYLMQMDKQDVRGIEKTTVYNFANRSYIADDSNPCSYYDDTRNNLGERMYEDIVQKYGEGTLVTDNEDEKRSFLVKYPKRDAVVVTTSEKNLIKQTKAYCDATENLEAEQVELSMHDQLSEFFFKNSSEWAWKERLEKVEEIIKPMIEAYEKAGGKYYSDCEN